MKNKKKTYGLLVLVIAVWGYIGYYVMTSLDPSLPDYTESKIAFKDDFVFNNSFEKFSIQRVNRDPFLGTVETPISQKTNTPKIKKQMSWKPISYLGMIANDTNKDKVFILSIANQQVLLKQGHTHDSVKVIRGNAKNITLRYKDNTKSFKLKT
ncbi:hypothetical protein BTO05_00600 [Winogradskyella sp. PC-19]|uniref:hypothetical protein n=1 Tax=Winogradskyella sp. PC-19 TaxID=754417 RepID=UPI000B3D3B8D|nr:hypothetical protein [Winogradskyella sp. PC-19]ARV08209.1 hypothetical protein BTO05_00600 [Winogradskyella sp. PC-19]